MVDGSDRLIRPQSHLYADNGGIILFCMTSDEDEPRTVTEYLVQDSGTVRDFIFQLWLRPEVSVRMGCGEISTGSMGLTKEYIE